MKTRAKTTGQVDLEWIGEPRKGDPAGVAFGVPWPQGSIRADEPLTLHVAGKGIPTQTWPLAYWPDGSVKWTGVAAVPGAGALTLRPGAPPPPATPLRCEEDADSITLLNGSLRCVVGRRGNLAIVGIRSGNVPLCAGGRLTAVIRRRLPSPEGPCERVETFQGRIDSAAIESAGPVRVVVKLQGRHVHAPTGRELFPFTLRLYFHAGDPTIGVTHFFVYDGKATEDFLQGIGMEFDVPLRDDLHNRRVWFGADGAGVWTENVRAIPPLVSGGGTPNPDRRRQVDGEFIDAGPQPAPKPYSDKSGVAAMPVWNDFRLLQDSADHFTIRKSCGPDYTALDAFQGRRAAGLAALSDSGGGLCIEQREFWQTHPSELAIRDASAGTARMAAWFWSPGAPAADMRHYTDKAYGALYENAYPFEWEACPYDPAWVSAYGVGKSSRLVIRPLFAAPGRDDMAALALDSNAPPMPACRPEYYHRCGVFGVWSLVSRGSPPKAAIEDRLSRLLDFYVAEVDRRSWYGFWNYGDVGHSYDPARHCWRYDEGGYGWQNNECEPDLWLWHSFLRTGRPDVFRLASAMSRHNADVDVLHAGPFAGLGTRHNVSHWGCSVKTQRVSHAGGRRFLYFLTAEEAIGDRLSEVLDCQCKGVVEGEIGQGWSSHCWNWLTAWERTGDPVWRDRILRGIDGLLTTPSPFVDGSVASLDMETGRLAVKPGSAAYHMTLPFGGPENWLELAGLLGREDFADAVAGYGRVLATAVAGETLIYAAGLIAYAGQRLKNRELAEKAWAILLEPELYLRDATDPVTGAPILDILRREKAMGHTNTAAQWSLHAIQVLELIPEPRATGSAPGSVKRRTGGNHQQQA